MLSATKREGAGKPAGSERFDPVPGTIVANKYRVERTLGEGGMGLVVAAVHLGLEQQVAIKFLLPEAMRNKVAVERFLREAKVAARVRSEHVARVHDVGTLDEGVPYIVMEHLDGLDLGALIDRDGALPIDEACEIALQSCEALAEVHAAGIVHRDLKPSNLFVTRRADGSPSVKLLDFGISKLSTTDESDVDPALTQTATIMGSPSYMSPEQLKSTKEVDHRADVWSLGAVLYEAITGKPAFRGESLPQVCAMIASEDPVLPSSRRTGIPLDLERTILRCLDKNPATRAELVDLARSLAKYTPDRARSSLERIEATAGVAPSPRSSRVEQSLPDRGDLPVLPLATADGRTLAAWDKDRRGKRGTKARRGAYLLLAVIGGLVGMAVYSGRVKVGRWRGELEGATSAVASAATAAAAAASAVSSAVASSMPDLPTLPGEDLAASAAAGSAEPASTEPVASATAPAAPAASHVAATAKPHPAAKPHHAAKPKHHHTPQQ